MQVQKILAFSDFLARSPKSYNEIAQFLVMNTFSAEEARCIYLGELTETGMVCPLGMFGWSAAESELFTDLPIQDAYPLTDAIRTNEVLVLQSGDEFDKSYPLMAQFGTSPNWVTGISAPVYPIGGLSLYTSKSLILDEPLRVFIVAIGSLLGLYASRLPVALVEVALDVKKKIELPNIPLTDRQLVIAGMLERGFNNAQIGSEIGYSESLIRQETVAIYRKLQVTGRQAMQAIRNLNLEKQGPIELTE